MHGDGGNWLIAGVVASAAAAAVYWEYIYQPPQPPQPDQQAHQQQQQRRRRRQQQPEQQQQQQQQQPQQQQQQQPQQQQQQQQQQQPQQQQQQLQEILQTIKNSITESIQQSSSGCPSCSATLSNIAVALGFVAPVGIVIFDEGNNCAPPAPGELNIALDRGEFEARLRHLDYANGTWVFFVAVHHDTPWKQHCATIIRSGCDFYIGHRFFGNDDAINDLDLGYPISPFVAAQRAFAGSDQQTHTLLEYHFD